MRVLIVSRAALVGGHQRKMEAIATDPAVDHLTVVVPPSWRDPEHTQPLEREHVDGYELAIERVMFDGHFHVHWYPGLPRRIASLRPDVVQVEEEPYNLATALALRAAHRADARTVCVAWQNIERRLPPPFTTLQRTSLRHTDHLVGGNRAAIDVCRARGYRGPASVIAMGVDPDEFAPAGRDDAHDFTVGYVGRLVDAKGVDTLLRAFARLPADSRLRVVGAGPARDALGALARDLGIDARTSFTEWVPSSQLPAVYASMDVLVLPSRTTAGWKEQFGRVLVEAMASGVAVVGSDSGEIPYVIADAGLVVPEGDDEAIAAALEWLRDDAARTALTRQAREHVLTTYTHEQIAARTVDVYRQVLADRRPR